MLLSERVGEEMLSMDYGYNCFGTLAKSDMQALVDYERVDTE